MLVAEVPSSRDAKQLETLQMPAVTRGGARLRIELAEPLVCEFGSEPQRAVAVGLPKGREDR